MEDRRCGSGRGEHGSGLERRRAHDGAPLSLQVLEDAADDGGLSDDADHAHRCGTAATDERINLVDAAEQIGPAFAQGSGLGWWL